MSFRVRLLPSGKEFTAEKNETVLEAALRSGISLNYSCNNGSCGGCGGRIKSGQVRETQQHDFHFSDTQKAQGHVLLCVNAAQSDLEIEVKEAGGIEDIPLQLIPTKVEQMERIQDDIMILHLRTPRSQTLRFLAGQHLSLAIAGMPPRNKSLASCPCNAMHLQFHIRRVPGDPFSEYVFTQLKVSQTVTVEGPWGNFSLDENSKRPIIFVAYETGFAPIKSIIEHAIALELEQPLHLYWMAHQPGNHYLNNLCRSWLDALDNFSYTALTGMVYPVNPAGKHPPTRWWACATWKPQVQRSSPIILTFLASTSISRHRNQAQRESLSCYSGTACRKSSCTWTS